MITSFDLSLASVDLLSHGLGVDCRLFPFQIPSFGATVADRIRVAGAVREDLQRRGLARAGDLVREVELAVRLFAEHDSAIAVVGDGESGALYARGSMRGRDAVLVIRRDNVLRFVLVRPEGLLRAVVDLLPPAQVGPGQSVTVSRPSTVATTDSEGTLRSVVRAPRTTAGAQLRVAQDILRRRRLGDGYFVVTRGKQRSPALSWIDTDAGRYLSSMRTDDRGNTHISYFPADDGRVVHALGELVSPAR
ncbi:MAG: ESX secretion-associated protein EspG [Actinomycetota bacterium]|nr:ESX secretion-associated protein EspG [Actinomycetota bacterium]